MFKVLPHDDVPLQWWYEQYQQNRIELHPPYQRRSGIWSRWKQAHLIDSVINEFDIPKFYIADFTRFPRSPLNTTKKPYAVIDGKQRLQALFDYMDDKFALNSSATFEDSSSAKVGGLTYSELSAKYPAAAQRIANFVPAVMDVVTDEEDRLEEMFVRLNSGEHTTGAEKRNSMPGPVPAIIRELSVHPFFQRKIKFDRKRMQEYNLVAKLLLIELKGRFVDTKAKNLDELARSADKELKAAASDEERAHIAEQWMLTQTKVFEVLEHMTLVFQDSDSLLANQGPIPIYYWLIRNAKHRHLQHVRPFLLMFTSAVKDNLHVQRRDPESADQRQALYYTMGRTTNDQQSLIGRYEILQDEFGKYLASRLDA